MMAIDQYVYGKVRALGVTAGDRSSALPNVPTYKEAGVAGVELAASWGLMAPTGTPTDIINRLNAEVNKALKLPELRDKILATGADILGGTPKQMGEQYAADMTRLAPVIRESGVKLE